MNNDCLLDLGGVFIYYLNIYVATAGREEGPKREVASDAGHDVRDAGETGAGRYYGRETEEVSYVCNRNCVAVCIALCVVLRNMRIVVSVVCVMCVMY